MGILLAGGGPGIAATVAQYMPDPRKPNPDEEPIQTLWQADGVSLRKIKVPKANTILPQHSHPHGHHTLVFGRIRAFRDQEDLGEFGGDNDILYIPANTFHHFVTLEDNVTLVCFHNLHGQNEVEILAEAKPLLKTQPLLKTPLLKE